MMMAVAVVTITTNRKLPIYI